MAILTIARARAGSRDHENPANRRDRVQASDPAWTRVPGLVFPSCSLVRGDERTLRANGVNQPRLPAGSPVDVVTSRDVELCVRQS